MPAIDFSRSQLERELKEILLVEARRLAFMSGDKTMAANFLGCDVTFTSDDGVDPDEVDLAKFEIASIILRFYSHVTGCGPWPRWSGPVLGHVTAFVQGVPSVTLDSEPFPAGTPEGFARRTMEVVNARQKLAGYIMNGGDTLLTVREMALAADMTERAVRNAISSKGPDHLETVTYLGKVYVGAEVALAWLSKRRNFRPIEILPSEHPEWALMRQTFEPAETLDLIRRLALAQFGTTAATAKATGLPETAVAPLFEGRVPDDDEALKALVAHLGFDVADVLENLSIRGKEVS